MLQLNNYTYHFHVQFLTPYPYFMSKNCLHDSVIKKGCCMVKTCPNKSGNIVNRENQGEQHLSSKLLN